MIEYTANMAVFEIATILVAGGLFIVLALYVNNFLNPRIVKIQKSSIDGGRDVLTVELKTVFFGENFSRRYQKVYVSSVVDGWAWVDIDSMKVVRSPGLKFELNCAKEIKLS